MSLKSKNRPKILAWLNQIKKGNAPLIISREEGKDVLSWFEGFTKKLTECDASGEKFIGFNKVCDECPFYKCIKEFLKID